MGIIFIFCIVHFKWATCMICELHCNKWLKINNTIIKTKIIEPYKLQ